MRIARFKVFGRFDGASAATVTIEHSKESGAGLFSVRPLHRKRTYTLTLEDVARGVIYDVVTAELREKRREKARNRKGGSR